jgi:hypothetical protein
MPQSVSSLCLTFVGVPYTLMRLFPVEASETGRVAPVQLPTRTVLSKKSVGETRMLATEIRLRTPDRNSRSNAIAIAHIVKNSLGFH